MVSLTPNTLSVYSYELHIVICAPLGTLCLFTDSPSALPLPIVICLKFCSADFTESFNDTRMGHRRRHPRTPNPPSILYQIPVALKPHQFYLAYSLPPVRYIHLGP